MALVTYLSRVVPFVLLPRERAAPRLERFLRYVPAAAIGALVFPDVLTGGDGFAFAPLLAASVAALLALRTRELWITVGGAIAVTYVAIRFLPGI